MVLRSLVAVVDPNQFACDCWYLYVSIVAAYYELECLRPCSEQRVLKHRNLRNSRNGKGEAEQNCGSRNVGKLEKNEFGSLQKHIGVGLCMGCEV